MLQKLKTTLQHIVLVSINNKTVQFMFVKNKMYCFFLILLCYSLLRNRMNKNVLVLEFSQYK